MVQDVQFRSLRGLIDRRRDDDDLRSSVRVRQLMRETEVDGGNDVSNNTLLRGRAREKESDTARPMFSHSCKSQSDAYSGREHTLVQ